MFSNDLVLLRFELPGAIMELAPKSIMSSGFCACEHVVKLFTFILTCTQG